MVVPRVAMMDTIRVTTLKKEGMNVNHVHGHALLVPLTIIVSLVN